MRNIIFLMIVGLLLFVPVSGAAVEDVLRKGYLNVDGAVMEEEFLFRDSGVYVPVKQIAKQLNITLQWDDKAGLLVFSYPDFSSIRASVTEDKIFYQETSEPVDFLVSGGKTYIRADHLSRVVWRQAFWDNNTRTLYVYMYSHPLQGTSLLESSPYEGLEIKENTVCLSVYGLPEASWAMEGQLEDLRMVGRSSHAGTEEIKLAAFYLQPSGVVSQLRITQRKLPNGDRVFFTRAYCPSGQQVLTVNTEAGSRTYGSSVYHFIDKGKLKEYQFEEPYRASERLILNAGTSIDQWHIFGCEDLEITDPIVRKAWNASLEYHGSNAWVTPEGAYRSTPVEYMSQRQLRNKNVNLQACSPVLLIETLDSHYNRLLESFVHSAKFTLVRLMGADLYWRAGLNVAYLNQAYSLGPNYIDTRMSVDASWFLVRYGLKFDDRDAVARGSHFKEFFKMLKSKNAVYTVQGGVVYPDYFSESQKKKTLVSLNHALYEMNYLYTLFNWLGDMEAKALADEMRLFIKNTAGRWIAPNGDLYYALSPEGEYYAEDYVNITYVDLFVSRGILKYMEVKDSVVESLFTAKNDYLNAVAAPQFESRLEPGEVLEKFDTQSSRKGPFFFTYPLEVKMAETAGNPAHFACGTYHWVFGAERVTYLDKSYELDPTKKYCIVLNKWGLTIMGEGDLSL